MTDEWLYFASGFFLAAFITSLLFVYEVVIFRPRPTRPGLFTWQRLPSGEEEVVLDDGRTFRGKGLAWHEHPTGVFAPNWLAKWLSEQARAARSIHAIDTEERRFKFDGLSDYLPAAKLQRRRKNHYGDN